MKLIDLVKKYKNSDDLTITIVSPFISKKFIETLKNELCPVRMLVVSDKRNELKIDEIAGIAKVEVRLAECLDGLVHAKLFLFDWKNGAKIFVWGSANATQSASEKNAECISLYKIRDSDNDPKSEIELYFGQLWQNKPVKIKSCHVTLGSMQFFLPEFSLIERQDSFDKWLEEGQLFDPETQSLPDSLKISLKKDYKITQKANDHGLVCQDKKMLIFKFSDFKGDSVPKINLPKIKNYAVNTLYGYWLSKEIIDWYTKSSIVQQLKGKVAQLRNFMERNHDSLIEEMIHRLQDVAKDLTSPLSEYFEDEALTGNQQELKQEYFQEILNEQLKEHIIKCKRFESDTLELRRLPRIRFDIPEWEILALSWITFVKQESSKFRGHNRISKIIFSRISEKCNHNDDLFSTRVDWTRPLDTLRKMDCWRNIDLGKIIVQEIEKDWQGKLNRLEKKEVSPDDMDAETDD